MATRMQQRRGTASQWTTANPILAAGEIGFESDTGQFKIGDGTNYWADLSYFKNIDDLGGNLDDYVPITLLGEPEGVATLDVNGQVPATQLGNAVTSLSGYATETYVNDAINGVIDGAPELLNTLNEIALAIADDENYAVSTVNYINLQVDNLTADIATAKNEAITAAANDLDDFNTTTIVPIQSDIVSLQTDIQTLDSEKQDIVPGVSSLEIGHLANVTSDIQGQLDAKAEEVHTHVVADISDIQVSASEINHLAGVTSDIQVQLDSKASSSHDHFLSDISDVTATANEVNVLSGITASTSELNVLDGILVSTIELNHLDGVTSSVQTQIDGKANSSHEHQPSDISGVSVSATEINSLTNIASNVQAQIDGKANSVHAHSTNDLVDLSVSAADINSLSGIVGNVQAQIDGKANTSHTHNLADVVDVIATSTEVNHLSGVTNNVQDQLDGLFTDMEIVADTLPTKQDKVAGVTDVEIGYLDGVTSGIQSQLDGKSATGHTHVIGDISGVNATATEVNFLVGVDSAIQDQLDGKAATSHTHAQSDITGLTSDLAAKANLSGATFSGNVEVPSMTVTGNLVVQGTTTTVDTTNYSIRDNMLYMNQAGMFAISDAVGDGTTVTYTAHDHDFQAGDYIVVTGVNPSQYNIAGTELLTIDSVTNNTFTVTKSATGTYVSGGTARGKSAANPDLGFAAGRTTAAGYAHTGLFRDASDGYFKFFDGYTPEPDESLFIDTNDASFELAPLMVSGIKAYGTASFLGDVSGITVDKLEDVQVASASDKDVLVYNGTEWVNKYVNAIPTKISQGTVTSNNYELVAADAGKIVEISNSSATTVTIPSDETFEVGSMIVISQVGAGQITVVVENPSVQTLNSTPGSKLRAQWSVATLLKRSANTWLVYGDLVA